MSVHAEQKSWSVPQLAQAREAGRRLTMLTCYDASFARVLDAAGIDLILVGDSLGMVVQGHDSTLPVRGGGHRLPHCRGGACRQRTR